ncbi:MAG: selenocysteine-specific translation elongation factor, partial [Fimbriiglobus sp.]|nr:selenocysteine-specific translation elongation factor [Fimbriiglobus sp.]
MPRDLILGTAGHIDHGKTSLVKALTGIDTDRLPEEKARGITIDIGFAHLNLGEYRLGIVDVPGHERFVKNMLAGATGIDLCVLIVAADDSVMPQTREHLEILKLLGLRHGVIALTKADLVDDITREVAELEVRELVRGSFLEEAPIVPTSAITGKGIAELKAAIQAVCERLAPAGSGVSPFRLPIDRSFTVQGHGTVVTGSIVGGGIKVGDELDWHKGDGSIEKVRVRGLTNHGKPTDEIHRGQRGGINLAGVPHDAVRRGQELSTPGYLAPSKVLTVRLHTLAAHRKPIKHRLPCRLHVGTAEVMVTVSLLDADAIEPGGWGMAQLFLEDPVTVVWGQPFVLRDSSAEHTIGGGQVLQPCGVKLRRRHLEHLERVEQLWSEDAAQRAVAVAWFAGFSGFQASDLTRDAGISPDQIEAVVSGLLSAGTVAELTLPPNRKLLVHMERMTELGERLMAVVGALHAEFPLMTNHERSKAVSRLDYVGDEALLNAVTDRLIKQKQLVGDARRIARADFKPKLSAAQRKLKDKIVDDHKKAAFQPPEASSYANQVGGNATTLREIFEVACAEGFLVRVTDEIYLH